MELNQIIIEGGFIHFTSAKGKIPLTFLLQNKSGTFPIKVEGRLADIALPRLKRGLKLRIVGKLVKVGNNTIVSAEHIEFTGKMLDTTYKK